jgi:hypothetical protein
MFHALRSPYSGLSRSRSLPKGVIIRYFQEVLLTMENCGLPQQNLPNADFCVGRRAQGGLTLQQRIAFLGTDATGSLHLSLKVEPGRHRPLPIPLEVSDRWTTHPAQAARIVHQFRLSPRRSDAEIGFAL